LPAPSSAYAVTGLPSSLAGQLDNATSVLVANNWATKPQLDHIRGLVINAKDPVPNAGRTLLAQFLLDSRLLPRDQVADLDAILKNQANLPQFQLLKKIGAGGMGTVFLAKHVETSVEVALKTINARLAEDKDFIERFHREARSLEQLRNEHIAQIIACGETDGTCWLAMEFIDGPSLMTLLKDHRVLPEAYALNIVRQIAIGLGHVWEKAALVHRDIKPENILVLRNRQGDELFPLSDVAKLIDFGLVKSNNEDDRLTQTGMTIGTPLYMSPEQVRGEKLDCRSDIYGLGATLYHLVTGSTPFTGTSPGAIMSAHLTETVPDAGDRVPSLSKGTRQLIQDAMAKSPDKRLSTFSAMVNACTEALEGLDSKTSASPKLLRKPLIIKNPARRSGEFSADGQDVNAATRPKSDAISRPKSDAISRQASTILTDPVAQGAPLRTASPTQQVPTSSVHRRPSTRPLTHIPGKKASTQASERRPVAVPTAPPLIVHGPLAHTSASSSEQPSPPSAAFIPPPSSAGVGMLPWIVLGFAVLALIVFVVVTYG
jgi:serine/threonine protein kinase